MNNLNSMILDDIVYKSIQYKELSSYGLRIRVVAKLEKREKKTE
jgi:hypothetical protein